MNKQYPQGIPVLRVFSVFWLSSVFMNRTGRADGFTLPATDAVFLNDCGNIRDDNGIRRTDAPASAAGNTGSGIDAVWDHGRRTG
jgi:hypothetical protein